MRGLQIVVASTVAATGIVAAWPSSTSWAMTQRRPETGSVATGRVGDGLTAGL
jgi:hypothetical protein